MAELVLDGIGHRYGEGPWVLEELSLAIADGEAHALLGPSGAGKTTLLKILSGLLSPTLGRVRMNGADVTHVPPAGRNVAQVFQFPVLYESLSVAENLAFPLRNRRVREPARGRRVREIAELLEIGARLGDRTAALSAYDRQLIALGRGLVRTDVAAVLLDEPLTAVEPATRWRLRRVLRTVRAELGVTMIYVTHDQLEALTFADRVSVLSDGGVLQSGSPEALYAEPAHAFVAHFIGSPGMNLVPGEIVSGRVHLAGGVLAGGVRAADGSCEVGFRPEAARIDAAATGIGGVTVTARRAESLAGDVPAGLVSGRFCGTDIATRQPLDATVGGGRLTIDRFYLFRDGRRLDCGGGDA